MSNAACIPEICNEKTRMLVRVLGGFGIADASFHDAEPHAYITYIGLMRS